MSKMVSEMEPPKKKVRINSNGNHESATAADLKVDERRVRVLSNTTQLTGYHGGGILYWMCWDQRVQDNWALIFAQQLALEQGLPLHVCVCTDEEMFLHSPHHYYSVFMGEGLKEVEAACKELNIQFHLLENCDPAFNVPKLVQHLNVDAVSTDFSPLRDALACVETVKGALPQDVPFFQVDSRNIVPAVWLNTGESGERKPRYGVLSLAKRIRENFDEFLTDFPALTVHPHHAHIKAEVIDWESVLDQLFKIHKKSVIPGTLAGLAKSRTIIKKRLTRVTEKKDDPHIDPLIHLNPWLQLGQISVQRLLLDVMKYKSGASTGTKARIELLVEAIIRRQLSDNFCIADDETGRLLKDERLLLKSISYSGSKGLWMTDFLNLSPHLTRDMATLLLERLLKKKLIQSAIEPKRLKKMGEQGRELYFLIACVVPYQRSQFVPPLFSQLPPWLINGYNQTLFEEFSASGLKFLEEALYADTEADEMTRELLIKFRQIYSSFEFSTSDVKFLLEWLIQEGKVEKVTVGQDDSIRYRVLVPQIPVE